MLKDIQQAESAIKAGNTRTAFEILRDVLENNPESERAWWIMSGLVQRKQRAACLEQVLRINPENQFARKALDDLLASPPGPESKPPRKIPLPTSAERSPSPEVDQSGLRTWLHSRGSKYFFTIMSPDQITSAITDSSTFASVRANLKKGRIPDQLMAKIQTVPLSHISSVKLVRSGFVVYYQDGITERSLRLYLENHAAAQRALRILGKQLRSNHVHASVCTLSREDRRHQQLICV